MKKIQGLGLSTRPQISIPLTVLGMGPNPQTAGIWGRGGAASRTREPERQPQRRGRAPDTHVFCTGFRRLRLA